MKTASSLNYLLRAAGVAGFVGILSLPIPAEQNFPPASRDLTMHETTTISGLPGAKTTSMTSSNYFGRNALRRSAPGGLDTIIRIDDGKIISIDHNTKTYSETTVQEVNQVPEKTAEEEGENEQQKEALRKMMGHMLGSFKVTKVGPGEPIAGCRTEKYVISGMMEMEIWAAPDLQVPGFYYEALKLQAQPNPIFDMGKLYEEFEKIEGMTLKTVTTMKIMDTEVRTITEVTSIDKSPIPASVFELPAGYRLVPSDLVK